MNIRLATAADIPELLNLERECESAAHWSEAQYAQFLKPQTNTELAGRIVLLAEGPTQKGPVGNSSSINSSRLFLGFLVARKVAGEWELENIGVAPWARRQGLASELVNELFRRAHTNLDSLIFLEVRESNLGARTFYEKLGFRESGVRRGYYRNPVEDGVLYRRELK